MDCANGMTGAECCGMAGNAYRAMTTLSISSCATNRTVSGWATMPC